MIARPAVVAWSIAAIGVALNVLFRALDLVNGHRLAPPIVGTLVGVSFLVVGALVATRRPRNPIGWLYLVAITVISFGGIGNVAEQYATYALVTRPGGLPAPEWVLWAGDVVILPAFVGLIFFSLLLLPDGRLRSSRWRPVAIAAGVALAALTLENAFSTRDLTAVPIANPAAIAVARAFFDVAWVPLTVVLLAVLLASLASVFLRFRDARGTERQQLKWFAYGAALIPAVVVFGLALGPDADPGFSNNLGPLSVAGIPVATAIAILRYRLYDIDLLINRTLVYGATTGAIGAAFFGGIVVLQTVLRPVTGGSELAVAITTLACFALFQPLRGRIQSAVDRRFYRSRYDAARTLDAFSGQLANEVDLDAVRAELLDAVASTVQPAHASVWLRERVR